MSIIETHAQELTENLLKDLQRNEGTPTYHQHDEKELYDRAFQVYRHLGKWISQETTKEEIAKHYTDLGAQRSREGFSLSEVIQALILTRRHLWFKILAEGFLDTALDLTQEIDLSNRIVRFFDRAIYYAAVGYEKGT